MAADAPTSKSPEDEIRDLKEKNNALVQKVQYWKMTAAQKDDEKLDLMKELNELRLTMSHYRNSGSSLDSALEVAMQEFGEHSLKRLVEASTSIRHNIEVIKTYIHKKREVESLSPCGKQSMRESSLRDRGSNKVLRVVPMIRGSAIIKPTIKLRPIDATAYGLRQAANINGDDNSSTTSEEDNTPPRQMLQEVYIPLQRIDAELSLDTVNVAQRVRSIDADDSLETNELALDEEYEFGEEGENAEARDADGEGEVEGEVEVEQEEDYNAMRAMNTLPEETEEENWSPQVRLTRQPNDRSTPQNPLEGPSWLLDRRHRATGSPVPAHASDGPRLEADSTTDAVGRGGGGETPPAAPAILSAPNPSPPLRHGAESPAVEYSPTQRVRRKRSRVLSPRVSLALLEPDWPRPDPSTKRRVSVHRRDQDPTKVLVLVSKMRLEELRRGAGARESPGDDVTPPRAPRLSLDAPSPNGSTQDAGPIIMDCPEVLAEGSATAHGVRRESATILEEGRENSSERRARRDAHGSRRDSSGHSSGRDGSETHRPLRESCTATIREPLHEMAGEGSAHGSVSENIADNVTVRGSKSSMHRTVKRSISVNETDRQSTAVQGAARASTSVQGAARASTSVHGSARVCTATHGIVQDTTPVHGAIRDSTIVHKKARESTTGLGTVQDSSTAHETVGERSTVQGTAQEGTSARETVRDSMTAHGTTREDTTAHGSARGASGEAGERARGSSESEGEAEEGRTKRRRRGQVSYKEKPLNRKLRR